MSKLSTVNNLLQFSVTLTNSAESKMPENTSPINIEKLTSLCKRRGFVFQSSEIYGGLASTWDYGPLGVELKRNVKDSWWKTMVWERDDILILGGQADI